MTRSDLEQRVAAWMGTHIVDSRPQYLVIADLLEQVQRETVKKCGEIIEDADDFCCFGSRLDLVLKLYREHGMEY